MECLLAAVANATFIIAEGSVELTFGWITSYTVAQHFTLSANTRYWIVLKTTAGDATHWYAWGYAIGTEATYKRGTGAGTGNAGVLWVPAPTTDYWFRLYYGGKEDPAANTYYYDVYYYRRFL